MSSQVLKSPDPFFLKGGSTGIMLIHGFTATPSEMSYLGRNLNQRGITVSAPLLPGHGSTPEDANRYRWQHWANHLTIAFAELQDSCSSIFLGGFSTGALLALYLASRLGPLDGIIAYAPAMKTVSKKLILAPVLKYFRRSVPKSRDVNNYPDIDSVRWAYKEYPTKAADELRKLQGVVRSSLGEVKDPLLVIYSVIDELVAADGVDLLLKRVGSVEKEVVVLKSSGHIITLDQERDIVAEKSLRFIEKYSTKQA